MEFSITTRRPSDGVVEIVPQGEIDLETNHEMSDTIDSVLVAEQPRLVRVDLSGVRFIDSAGVSALVRGYHAAAVCGARLVVTSPTDSVYRQLYISGLVGLLGAPRPREPSRDPGRLHTP